MREGDKIYCKYNFEYHFVFFNQYECFEIVDIDISMDIKLLDVYSIENDYSIMMRDDIIEKHFYTTQQMRQHKLQTLNLKQYE